MAKLTIEQISIENLGPIREYQTFDLSVQPSRPVILVKALNGSGKTTLLTALQVGLYGYKAVNALRRSEYEQLIAGLQRKDANGHSRIEMHLTIQVGDFRQHLTIRREWFKKDKGFRETFRVFAEGAEDLVLADNWDDFINGILPVELVNLFLFDGEKIEALANPERLPALLRRATEVFLGLGGIDALVSDLKAVERRAVKRPISEAANEDQKLAEEYEVQLSGLQQKIEILVQRMAQSQIDLDNAQQALDIFTLDAQKNGLNAYQQAADLKARAEMCHEKYRQAENSLVSALEDPLLPIAWLGPLWGNYKTQWQDEQDSKHYELLTKEFAKRDERILKALNGKGIDFRNELDQILKEDLNTLKHNEKGNKGFLQGGDPSKIERQLSEAKLKLRDAREELKENRELLEISQHSIDQIPAMEQLNDVFVKMQKHTQNVASKQLKTKELEKEIEDARSKFAHFESRYNSALARSRNELKEHAFQVKSLEAGDRARSTLDIFRDRLLASKAKWLSEMITSEFRNLLRKKNFISNVVIEPQSYEVSIVDINGHVLPMERLSAGERQILAIAVLSALIKERKGRFPVVVDTPLARLDRTHRETLIHNFFAQISHQVMVLSTDEEVEGPVYKALEPHLSREYALLFNDEERRSIVKANPAQMSLGVL
ncbi:DNA sulfur modification protein DndD [Pseudomonas sp. AA27]|uniref:DNA sulfur modification protein DndD n=1 Tax=Pseudomonas sp. AA27 TaxID=2908652 RepID=UPI001F1EDCA8|nr:DNA sulfur modification protein DndD [Pseudomonas sp. AA27]MCF1489972.1 DNA sulfur modification protein DndD [Pseudomonas sp. AA27]